MATIEKVERVSATMQVVNSIKAALQKGEYKVGDKLPSEAELAKEIGVGRSSFREGMRVLAAYGIVEIRQGEGTFIVNRFAEHVFDFMGFLPTVENILFLVEMRKVIEIGSVGLIIDRLTDEQCDEFRVLAEKIQADGNTKRNIEADGVFHAKLINYTENPLIIETYHMMRKMMGALMSELMCRDDVVLDARSSHIKIYEALSRRDAKAMSEAIGEHLQNVYAYTEEYYPKNFD